MHGTTIQKTLKNARYNNTKKNLKCTVQQYKKHKKCTYNNTKKHKKYIIVMFMDFLRFVFPTEYDVAENQSLLVFK